MYEKEKLSALIYQNSLSHIDSIIEARKYLEQGMTELAYKVLKNDIFSFYNDKKLYSILTKHN